MSDIHAPLIPRRRSETSLPRHSGEEEEEEEDERHTTDYGSGVYHYPAHLQHGHFTSLEKLMFFASSILLILLCVFVGLYARSSQRDDPAPAPSPPPKVPKNHTKNQSYCLDYSCIITAGHILQDVDLELDPCDDFYAYACNNWKNTHLIPDVRSKIDIQSIATETIHHRLDQILSRGFDKFRPARREENLPDPNRILDRQLFTKLSDFYESCMDQDTVEKTGVEPLYRLFRTIRDYIPLDGPIDRGNLNKAITYLADRDIWTLFEIQTTPDTVHPSRISLSLTQGQIGLPHRELYDDPQTMSVYMRVVTALLDAIFKRDDRNEFGWKTWSTIATARRIVEFEKKLAEATFADDPHPQRWSLEQLQEEAPSIDWKSFIEHHTEQLPDHILIPTPTFIQNYNAVIQSSNGRTLQMYLIWRTIWKYLNVLGDEFVTPKRALDAKLSGIEPRAKPERRDVCIDLIDRSAMGLLMGRYFVQDHQQWIVQAKPKLEEMAHLIVDTLQQRVPYLEWIPAHDNKTRDEIVNKLKNIDIQVGYSTSEPSVLDVISLSEYFGDITIDKKDLFGNVLRNNKHRVKQTWKSSSQSVDRHDWKMNAQSVDVVYDRKLNKVIVPGGLLQLPYFDPNGPQYLYVGTIGWMIGHEIMHGFDSIGRNYNTDGKLGHWWANETLQRLERQNQCLVSQYDGLGVNGQRTLDNNFADQAGLLIESLLPASNKTKIPGLDAWTQEQLAYIQFARIKCSKSTPEQKLLLKDTSPDRLRVNGPLINSRHFSQTFQCKEGSFMNPKREKCQVW